MKTMIYLILDRSGSMSGRETDVVGGVNAFIEKQKQLQEPASIAFIRFDTGAIERFRPMQNLHAAMPIANIDFVPRGGTPLLDAIGRTLSEADADWVGERPDQAIAVIVTDGMENASTYYSKVQIKRMIEARQESGKWAFIYLGANVDAFTEARTMGIWAANTAGYTSSAMGTASSYNTVSETVGNMRMTGSKVASNLGGTIAEDGTVKKWHPNQAASEASTTGADTWTPPA